MGDLIVKPATGLGNSLKIQDQAGQECFSTVDDGATLTNKVSFPAGHVIQLVSNSAVCDHSGAGNSFSDQVLDGFSTSITPTSASNKLFLQCCLFYAGGNNNYCQLTFERAISGGTTTTDIMSSIDGTRGLARIGPTNVKAPVHISYLDSPNTTSAVTYQVRFRNHDNSTTVYVGAGTSTMTIMEIQQ